MQKIKIKYLADIEPIDMIGKGDWVDLRSAERVVLRKGDFRLIPLGVAMELPKGYEGHIAPRSSTFKKWGILQTNGIGIVDNTYCGDNDEWMMPVYATVDTVIEKNDRICQFRVFQNQEPIEFVAVESLGNADRNGFGSTGTN